MQSLNQNKSELVPFLKWAGGKKWLVKRGSQVAPPSYKRYIEPFLGGAAVFFSLPGKPYIISDVNPELINCYNAIKTDFKEVEKHLRSHQRKHCDDYYYQVRKSQPRKKCTKAAKFLYLNRTCWNGLYRVNLQGKFNVPRGTKNKVLLDTDNFEKVANRLSKGEILCQDFEQILSLAGEGDFVFIDPPYTVNHNLNGFLKYNEKIFSWADQERLKVAIASAVSRGAMITMTNADHDSIHNLYAGMCKIEKVERRSVIAGKSSHRGVTSEILMRIGWETVF